MSNNFTLNNKRIAKNTMLLYFRMGVAMVVGLYTSRLLLQALGVEDYGISNVVGGLVSLFSIVSGSLTAAISRFLTFEIGKNDLERLTAVFSSSVFIQFILAIIVVAICELIGSWFMEMYLVIPIDRVDAAWWVFHLGVISFGINILSVPYASLIVAHERMSIYAYIGLLNVFINLLVTLVVFLVNYDKLILWAFFTFFVNILTQLFYYFYCKKNFVECNVSLKFFDRNFFKDIFFFAGWNFIGNSASILRDQGGNILLNIFCGPAVNAARGVAMTINSKVSQFISNFTMAVNPQITKLYASGDYNAMFTLIFRSARFSYLVFFIISLPLILNIDVILKIWLTEVPKHSQSFAVLVMLYSLIETLSNPLITAMLASGKIRNYQLVVGSLQLLNLPLSYLCLKLGFPPESVFIVALFCSLLCLLARIFMLHLIMPFKIAEFMSAVILRIFIVTILGILLPIGLYNFIEPGFLSLLLITFVSLVWTSLIALYIGCTTRERVVILDKFTNLFSKYFKKW